MHKIQYLAGGERRVRETGMSVFADTDVADPVRQVWQRQVDGLTADLANTEHDARAAGVDLTWIHDARTVGSHQGASSQPGQVRRVPVRELGIERFFLDLLDLDLWQVERMAALDVALHDRAATGHGAIAVDSARESALLEHMLVRFSRASSLVAAVQITPDEGERMWGTGADAMRRMHATATDLMSDTQLLGQWQEYADADARLRTTLYLRQDPDTGKFLEDGLTGLPTPHGMIARVGVIFDARAAEGTEYPGTVQPPPTAAAGHQPPAADAIGSAVEATSTDTQGDWAPDPRPDPDPPIPGRQPGHEPGQW
ncbi:hypothetical protein ACFWPX_03270 [Nocardia sp. NPDC058518]|uniref:hypothetical protein n=1 Tax=Nocardia sp. NPDC058518 TaxID=3346534 RepID=UPI0036468D5C